MTDPEVEIVTGIELIPGGNDFLSDEDLLENEGVLSEVRKRIGNELISWINNNTSLRSYRVQPGRIDFLFERSSISIGLKGNKVILSSGGEQLVESSIFGAEIDSVGKVVDIQVDLITIKKFLAEMLSKEKEKSDG